MQIDDNTPALLVAHEKHGNRYFLLRSDADLHAAALSLLRERLSEGYYNEYKRPDPGPLDFTAEDAASMPESVRAAALQQLALRENERREWKRMRTLAGVLEKAEGGDGACAWRVLQAREGHQYERVELERFSRPVM